MSELANSAGTAAQASATTSSQAPVGAVFAALADPTRRHVVELLSQQPTVTASGLAQELPISRQAIAKHLRALTQAGLLTCAQEGRETHYRLSPQPLGSAMQWMASAGARWDGRLARLQQELGERR
ncbi:MAG TPA: metalloregulator ArsR/SmtB family transcription factor [Solirubrobacteraceae bacterium]|jgi:DNA-binding transcriptional ArsR family regulator|nr:metalloregulator ArsR/SmtB family transcription factor [Solirubrobacteraceae bacterium]